MRYVRGNIKTSKYKTNNNSNQLLKIEDLANDVNSRMGDFNSLRF